MGSLPVVKVEIAFDSGFSTLMSARTYTDVSSYVEGQNAVTLNYGRADEQSQPSPGHCTLTLNNADGRFTPEKATSPYYPNVKKGKPIRVTVTYPAIGSFVRFTGYVDEWPVVWPDGSSAASTVTINCVTRRARLGQTAPLPSAIHAANLAVNPQSYWPMTENDRTNAAGTQQLFYDDTDGVSQASEQYLAAFFPPGVDGSTLMTLHDGTPGPTDEESLVKFHQYSDTYLNRYVGGARRMSIGVNNGSNLHTGWMSCVARVSPHRPATTSAVDVNLMQAWSADQQQSVWIFVYDNSSATVSSKWVGISMELRDENGVLIDSPTWFPLSGINLEDLYARATDGQIHHYFVFWYSDHSTASPYAQAGLYFDGVQVAVTLSTALAYTKPFTNIAIGSRTRLADAWIGHVAVDDGDSGLTEADVAAFAGASLAATESTVTRVQRIGQYLGIPAAEILADATIAAPLGPQAEKDQSAVDVLDKVAQSTGGVLYDKRTGEFALQSRNARYAAANAFTLSTSGDEIEADLTPVLDARYLANTATVTRAGTDSGLPPFTATDAASVAEYGVYSQPVDMVSSSGLEVEALARDIIYRYADPAVRINQVSVDLVDLSSSQRALVLAADIGTKFTLSGLPSQAPSSSMSVYMEGYTETISADGHTLTINTTPADYPAMAVAGTATVGSSTFVVY